MSSAAATSSNSSVNASHRAACTAGWKSIDEIWAEHRARRETAIVEGPLAVDIIQGLDDLASLAMVRCATDIRAQYQLAVACELSVYDAAYLQLALEMNAPLVTYDSTLGQAAARLFGRG